MPSKSYTIWIILFITEIHVAIAPKHYIFNTIKISHKEGYITLFSNEKNANLHLFQKFYLLKTAYPKTFRWIKPLPTPYVCLSHMTIDLWARWFHDIKWIWPKCWKR